MGISMATPRLLVVDDEPFNLEIIGEYLDGAGVDLDTAENGERAWAMLEGGNNYSAVLLDRMMPVLDGMSLLRRIKRDDRFLSLPVIMQTAAGSSDQVREGLAAGAYYYLVKPYERDALLSIVRSALADNDNRYRMQQQLAEHASAPQMLTAGEFAFRTIEEAGILAAFLAQTCPDPEKAVLGLSELLINGVEHGNLGISYAEKSRLRREDCWNEEVRLRLALPENLGKRVRASVIRKAEGVVVRIVDEGNGFDWQKYLDFDPERAFDPNGRGIALTRLSGFATLDYEGCGNAVTLYIGNVR